MRLCREDVCAIQEAWWEADENPQHHRIQLLANANRQGSSADKAEISQLRREVADPKKQSRSSPRQRYAGSQRRTTGSPGPRRAQPQRYGQRQAKATRACSKDPSWTQGQSSRRGWSEADEYLGFRSNSQMKQSEDKAFGSMFAWGATRQTLRTLIASAWNPTEPVCVILESRFPSPPSNFVMLGGQCRRLWLFSTSRAHEANVLDGRQQQQSLPHDS